jgi:hypothetical protein
MRKYENEGDVKKEVKKILNQHEWFWWMPPANGFGKSNVDFNAIRGGVFMAIETKYDKRKCTPLQLAYLSSIQKEDGFGFVVTEKNIEHFRTWMQVFDRSAKAMMAQQTIPPEDGAAMLEAIRILTEPYVFAKPAPSSDAAS